MTANEFDELVARLTNGASRRDAVRGIVGGAITSAGAASVAAAKGRKGKRKGKGQGKKHHGKQAAGETNVVGNRERIFCFCPDDDPLNCRTRRVKTKKFRKLMRKHPDSQRGPCQDATTLPPTTQGPTTLPPTTQGPTSTTTTTPTSSTTTPPPPS